MCDTSILRLAAQPRRRRRRQLAQSCIGVPEPGDPQSDFWSTPVGVPHGSRDAVQPRDFRIYAFREKSPFRNKYTANTFIQQYPLGRVRFRQRRFAYHFRQIAESVRISSVRQFSSPGVIVQQGPTVSVGFQPHLNEVLFSRIQNVNAKMTNFASRNIVEECWLSSAGLNLSSQLRSYKEPSKQSERRC